MNGPMPPAARPPGAPPEGPPQGPPGGPSKGPSSGLLAGRSAVLLAGAGGGVALGAGIAYGWGAGLAALVVALLAGAAGRAAGTAAAAPRLAAARRAAEASAEAARAAEAARLRAAEESRAKSRFLAETSHELRTPLNAIMGFSEMMADEVLGPHAVQAYGGYARDIHAAGRHLLALADDLLDLARIETGHRALLETPVDLDALAEDCLRMVAPDAAARRQTLERSGAPAGTRLWGDERAVRQMVLNLLANAVKFTAEGGTVRVVSGRDAAGAPFLVVEDSGRGAGDSEPPLPLAARHRESTLDLATGRGAGLGLAIVQGLAALHGGSLALTRLPSGGTEARLAFPRGRALPPRG